MSQASEDVNKAFQILFEETFYSIMMAVIKAKPNDPVYSGLSMINKNLTRGDVRKIANYASIYYVDHANPSVDKQSKTHVRRLQDRAIRKALKQFADV